MYDVSRPPNNTVLTPLLHLMLCRFKLFFARELKYYFGSHTLFGSWFTVIFWELPLSERVDIGSRRCLFPVGVAQLLVKLVMLCLSSFYIQAICD
jgi:hypothetical protein